MERESRRDLISPACSNSLRWKLQFEADASTISAIAPAASPSAPTFTKCSAPELGPNVPRYVVDCRHGTTIGDVIRGGRYTPTDPEILSILVDRHEREQHCGCARALLRVRAPGAAN